MDRPLIAAAGNALEVAAAMEVLEGGAGHPRLRRLTEVLGGEVLALGGLASSVEEGMAKIAAALDDGRACERFCAMVAAQGGPADFDVGWRRQLPRAEVVVPVPAPRDGIAGMVDGQALGMVVVGLGGGRRREGDGIDPRVGLSDLVAPGTRLDAGAPLAMVHAADLAAAERAVTAVLAAHAAARPAAEAPAPLLRGRVA